MAESSAVLTSHDLHDSVPEDVYGSWSPVWSPEGRCLAFISDRGGEPQVWVAGQGEGEWSLLATPMRRVVTVSGSPDGEWLCCVATAHDSSRLQVWTVRPDGSDLRLAAGDGGSTALIGAGPWRGWSADNRLMVTEIGSTSVALLVDPATGRRDQIVTGPLLALLDLSADGQCALLRRGPRGARQLVVVDRHSGTQRALRTGAGAGSVDIAALSPDGSTVYARSDVGRELAALVAVRVADGSVLGVVAERTGAELQDLALNAAGTTAVLVWNVHGGHSALSVVDLASGHEREVDLLPRDVVDECRFGPTGDQLLMTAESWSDPRGVWSLDLDSGAGLPVSSTGGRTLRSSREASPATIDTRELASPELRHLVSADGTALTGWLYHPEGPAPWPTMIHLHGGPEAQERPVYNSLFQSLVAEGVAVFAPNVRGSTGFGRRFVCADNLAGRYGAIDDVAATVAHLVDTGVAEAGRIGVMGRSYGGYLTLAALVWHPELFAVGVDVCGMADFATWYAETEPWIAASAMSKYGDPVRDADLLRDLSPLHRLDRLRAPLLVVHGGQDTNVPHSEAEQVVAALAERGVEHSYLLFPDEGHELLATGNRVRFVQTTVAWVLDHLG
ncbi:MAG: alpha/beta fold hydrolase [Mycobacteriales bacterium]